VGFEPADFFSNWACVATAESTTIVAQNAATVLGDGRFIIPFSIPWNAGGDWQPDYTSNQEFVGIGD
jgi:hypothetical protein